MAYLEAVYIGQHDVEQDQVGPGLSGQPQALPAGSRLRDLISGLGQQSRRGAQHERFVVYDEYPSAATGSLVLGHILLLAVHCPIRWNGQ